MLYHKNFPLQHLFTIINLVTDLSDITFHSSGSFIILCFTRNITKDTTSGSLRLASVQYIVILWSMFYPMCCQRMPALWLVEFTSHLCGFGWLLQQHTVSLFILDTIYRSLQHLNFIIITI